ncbi:5'-methylthioadenosine/S-adenosylhomocysteine nucleosidase [Paludicola sp. MB14-C6]|uniref:5'-methylthioadenosine/S-adenosylhomocysteine nucleosidase n=1 Tax=Paludihabitans sp. MB14-C6 TaxID=3070656 RepID=UPI0027DE5E59|nr:5'-methylthioadenosine/S-adenosylhomocysteine nucleosidase [Paludicola sp. MB14-C6]WMJ24218.1 5'-methylthioadenosine/S-adenosylhomocysteine nucleosidase [Paludicola sp. MB14-C6]
MICVFGTEEQEVKMLLKTAQIFKVCKKDGITIYETLLSGNSVIVAVIGYGKVNVGRGIGVVLGNYPITQIIGVGNCGSLIGNNAPPGTMAISSNALQYDVDFSAIGCPVTVLPGTRCGTTCANSNMIKAAQNACRTNEYQFTTGRFCTADMFVSNTVKAKAIRCTFCGDFVDCEVGCIGEVANSSNIPFVCVKGISNTADNNAAKMFDANQCKANDAACRVAITLIENLMSETKQKTCQ